MFNLRSSTWPKSQLRADWAVYRALADLLIDARLEAGLNQTELGARLGVTQKFISVIETGARRVDLLEFLAIEYALGLPRFSLVKRLDEHL